MPRKNGIGQRGIGQRKRGNESKLADFEDAVLDQAGRLAEAEMICSESKAKFRIKRTFDMQG